MSILGLGRNRHYISGMKYFDHGQFEFAIRELELVLSVDSGASDAERKLAKFNIGEAHWALADDYLQRQHWGSAEEALRRATDINPSYADLRYQLARIYYFTERLEESASEVNYALEINPSFAKAVFLDGLIKYRTGDRESGLRRFNDAANIEANYKGKDLETAFQMDVEGEYNKALDILERIGEMCIDEVAELIRCAKEKLRLGDFDEAEKSIREALSINPDYADLHNLMGRVWLHKNELLRAVNEFKVALLINPKFVAAYVNLGMACKNMGNEDIAKSSFKQALSLDPDNDEAKAALGRK